MLSSFKNTKSCCFFCPWHCGWPYVHTVVYYIIYCPCVKQQQCSSFFPLWWEELGFLRTLIWHMACLQCRGTAGCSASFCLQNGKTHQKHTASVDTRTNPYQQITGAYPLQADQLKYSYHQSLNAGGMFSCGAFVCEVALALKETIALQNKCWNLTVSVKLGDQNNLRNSLKKLYKNKMLFPHF